MADTKISSLSSLTGANTDTTADLGVIVDTSASQTKKIVIDQLAIACGSVLATEQATTSGTSIDFTSLPTWITRIDVMLCGVSTNGTSGLIVQLGDSGGIETSGYNGAVVTQAGTVTAMSSGFMIAANSQAARVWEGVLTLVLEDSSDFTFVGTSVMSTSDSATSVHTGAGRKATSAQLDRVRLTTVNGTDTFDAGAVNIRYYR